MYVFQAGLVMSQHRNEREPGVQTAMHMPSMSRTSLTGGRAPTCLGQVH